MNEIDIHDDSSNLYYSRHRTIGAHCTRLGDSIPRLNGYMYKWQAAIVTFMRLVSLQRQKEH